MKIASVIVDVPTSATNQTYDYLVPEKYHEIITPGMRVTVPFGPRKIMGFVVQLKKETHLSKVKELHEVLDITPVLTEELLQLGKSVAKKHLAYILPYFKRCCPRY